MVLRGDCPDAICPIVWRSNRAGGVNDAWNGVVAGSLNFHILLGVSHNERALGIVFNQMLNAVAECLVPATDAGYTSKRLDLLWV